MGMQLANAARLTLGKLFQAPVTLRSPLYSTVSSLDKRPPSPGPENQSSAPHVKIGITHPRYSMRRLADVIPLTVLPRSDNATRAEAPLFAIRWT